MKIHIIKILNKFALEVKKGNKTFELRKNDRDYQIGDLIKFIIVGKKIKNFEKKLFQITYVVKDVKEYGLMDGYCIFSFKERPRVDWERYYKILEKFKNEYSGVIDEKVLKKLVFKTLYKENKKIEKVIIENTKGGK